MQGSVSVLLLISAVLTCMALGVAMAYGVCAAIFAAIRPRHALVPAVAVSAKLPTPRL
jgi:hypothetical protein